MMTPGRDDETILVKLARIDERTKNIEKLIEAHLEADVIIHGDHEKRIRIIERRINMALGILALATLGGGTAVASFFN